MALVDNFLTFGVIIVGFLTLPLHILIFGFRILCIAALGSLTIKFLCITFELLFIISGSSVILLYIHLYIYINENHLQKLLGQDYERKVTSIRGFFKLFDWC